jgi:uncharacterized FlgJ-related protein
MVEIPKLVINPFTRMSAFTRRVRRMRLAVLYRARKPEWVAGGTVSLSVLAMLVIVIAFPHRSGQVTVEIERRHSPVVVRIEPVPVEQEADLVVAKLDGIDDLDQRKRLFLRVMLPIIIGENHALADNRQRLLENKDAVPYDLVAQYGTRDRDALLARVDVIPPSLVLAQAAVESGWGTSRFAREGNSFFGQRAYGGDVDGLVPERATGFTVRRFETIADSVRAYLHNLNTHGAYREFRAARAAMRRSGDTLVGPDLAVHLSRYSEEGHVYVEKLRRVIKDNHLLDLDETTLGG